MIVFENVSKKYPIGTIALDDASFSIDDCEFVFLVGPSGAGKTTILKLLIKSILPSSGSIFVNGVDIVNKKYKDTLLLRRSIGMVFQDFKIITDKSIFENIAVSLAVSGTPARTIKDNVTQVLELVGLSDKTHMFPLQLSAGELQRIAIARAVVGDRDIILADEPTGNLDPKTSWDIMKIFKQLEGKKTIIIATHNAEIVNSFKKRVITLSEGKIIKDKRKGDYRI